MVLKGTKRSLRTGNTLRNIRDRQTNERAGSVIVRHVTQAKGRQLHPTDEADDAHLTADGVEFSLNKKGRWNLPEVIEENIVYSDTGDATVSLLRRHRLNRQSDCLSVVANSAPTGAEASSTDASCQRKKARRRTYCNGLNVLHNGRGKSTKEKKKKQVVSTKKDLAQQKQPHTEEPVQENTEEDIRPSCPEVRYDVFYPLPATSSMRFHPKFTATNVSHPSELEQKLTVTAKLKPSKGSYQRCKHVDYDIYGEDDSYSDWMYDEEDYEDEEFHTEHATGEEYGYDEPQTKAFSDSLFLYSDIVEQAFEVSLLCSAACAGTRAPVDRKPRRRRRKNRGGYFFYKPETQNEVDSCLEDNQSEISSESDSSFSSSPLSKVIKLAQIPSVLVELSREATSSQRLAEHYGPSYSEAVCSPRKIVMDITDRVQAAVTDLAAFSNVFVPSLDLTTYLVFTYICDSTQERGPRDSCGVGMDSDCPVSGLDQCSASQYDVFRVQLNTNCTAQELTFCLQGKTAFDSVEEVLEQVLTFIMTLTPENIARHPSKAFASALKSRLTPDFSTVAEVNGWKPSCVSLLEEQETSLPAIFPGSPLQSLNTIDGEEQDSCFPPTDDSSTETQSSNACEDVEQHLVRAHTSGEMFCHICFGEILPGSLEGPHGTALTRCRHWFCDTCWQSHVWVALQEGSGGQRLQCPEFRCHVEVDLGTLLSLQHVRDVMVQRRRLVEVKVTRMFLCKWCPNPHCGRVVQLPHASSTIPAEPTSMTCPCGQRFCFRCHGDPHWPLSCDELIEYHALLRKRGHLTHAENPQKTVVVRGKPCPSCHRFIEKQGGCPQMICLCGFQFWWCCGKPITTRHNCTTYLTITDTTNTVKKLIRERESRPCSQHQSEWYEMAIRHRSQQHSRRVKHDYRRAEQLRRRLQSLSAKGVDIGAPLVPLPENGSSLAQTEMPASLRSGSDEEVVKSRADGRLHYRTVAKGKARSRARAVSQTDGMSTSPAALERARGYVKETAQAMIKLKVELHNVAENTAAFLHLRHDAPGTCTPVSASVSKVKDTAHYLQFLISSLDDLLVVESGRDLTRVLPWFRRLQRDVKDTLATLSGLINK